MPSKSFWQRKKVLVTGHTGFKGAWLCLWLELLGAEVTGYSMDIPTTPSLFKLTKPAARTIWGDVRDLKALRKAVAKTRPDIVFHLAAQPLVRASYADPITTFETNVLGTANVLESLRGSAVKAAVMITTDKVYDNKEQGLAFKETDSLGGYDPYSASKGAAEIVISSYRNSFFNTQDYGRKHSSLVASARAGNVIGGGDFAQDRLIPDIVRALSAGEEVLIRHPQAVRPWQHVLEPLAGYLLLGEKLYKGQTAYAEAWNFGPARADAKPVEWIVKRMCAAWGAEAAYSIDHSEKVHEAHHLQLDITKARERLGWQPRWRIAAALDHIVEWTQAYQGKQDVKAVCLQQIKQYSKGH